MIPPAPETHAGDTNSINPAKQPKQILTDNLIEDVLCMTLKVWDRMPVVDFASFLTHKAGLESVLPAFKPSPTLLRMVANRYNRAYIAECCAEGELSQIQAIFSHGGHQDKNAYGRSLFAAEMLAPAVVQGRTHVLEWWFTTAAKAGLRPLRAPYMPHLETLLSKVCQLVKEDLEQDMQAHSEDSTMVALKWLWDHDHLPSLEQLDDECEPGYSELYLTVASVGCRRITHFFLNKYGATDLIVRNDETIIDDTARIGDTDLLVRLIEQFPDQLDTLYTYGSILAAGKVHVLDWWVAYVRSRPQLTVGLRAFLSADPDTFGPLPPLDPARPELFLAHFLEQDQGDVTDALTTVCEAPNDRDAVAVLDWFVAHGMFDIVQGERLQAKFSAMIGRVMERNYTGVLDWWFAVDVPGLEKRVEYSHIKRWIQGEPQVQEWWRRAGLQPELPVDTNEDFFVGFPVEGQLDFSASSSAAEA